MVGTGNWYKLSHTLQFEGMNIRQYIGWPKNTRQFLNQNDNVMNNIYTLHK